MTSTSMNNIYNQLRSVGISKAFARKIFPEWWQDAITDTESGLQQAHLYISRAFNIDLKSLQDATKQPQFHNAEHKFKLNRNVTEEQVAVSAHYVTSMAKLALKAMPQPYQSLPLDPAELRAQVLESNKCVNLDGLLSYCFEMGVPVLHIDKVPGNKMTGLAIRLNDRYAIVLSRKEHPAYLLFHLAHELGHIARKHLTRDGFIADEKINGVDIGDADEKEADAYAIRLLNGEPVKYTTKGKIKSGKELFTAASVKAEAAQVDVGHIILNFANTQKNFPLANTALKFVSGSDNGAEVINTKLFANLDLDSLSEEQLSLLRVATSYLIA